MNRIQLRLSAVLLLKAWTKVNHARSIPPGNCSLRRHQRHVVVLSFDARDDATERFSTCPHSLISFSALSHDATTAFEVPPELMLLILPYRYLHLPVFHFDFVYSSHSVSLVITFVLIAMNAGPVESQHPSITYESPDLTCLTISPRLRVLNFFFVMPLSLLYFCFYVFLTDIPIQINAALA